MRKNIALLLFSFCLLIAACTNKITDDGDVLFEEVWKDFHEHYGMLEVKNIDWDSAYTVYKPQFYGDMPETEFYDRITMMLTLLDDRNVIVYPATSVLPNWSVHFTDGIFIDSSFRYSVVKNNYVAELAKVSEAIDCGKINGHIGYIYIRNFSGDKNIFLADIDECLQKISGCDALIIDVRACSTGFDPIAQAVAGKFTTQQELYMITRKKKGPNAGDFSTAEQWFVSPASSHWNKPVALLTGRGTQSSGETFTLALATQPSVTVVGDTTAGAFSEYAMFDLPNGWTFTVPTGDYRDRNNISWESKGLIPGLPKKNNPATLLGGQDEALEEAIALFP